MNHFAERLIEQGMQQGVQQGMQQGIEGLRAGITAALQARALTLSELGRARLAACADVSTLTKWLTRAITASHEADIFGSSDVP